MCKGGWGTGCVGRVGPIKDSITYCPSSHPGSCLSIIFIIYYCFIVCTVFCVLSGLGWGFNRLVPPLCACAQYAEPAHNSARPRRISVLHKTRHNSKSADVLYGHPPLVLKFSPRVIQRIWEESPLHAQERGRGPSTGG